MWDVNRMKYRLRQMNSDVEFQRMAKCHRLEACLQYVTAHEGPHEAARTLCYLHWHRSSAAVPPWCAPAVSCLRAASHLGADSRGDCRNFLGFLSHSGVAMCQKRFAYDGGEVSKRT
eukprot:1411314-Amphidinium_carterae.1